MFGVSILPLFLRFTAWILELVLCFIFYKTTNVPSLGQEDHKCAIVGTRRPQMFHRWDKKTTNVPSLGQEDHKCAIVDLYQTRRIYFASVSTIYRLDFGTGFMLYLLSSNRIVLEHELNDVCHKWRRN
jgi:hypothetical protein